MRAIRLLSLALLVAFAACTKAPQRVPFVLDAGMAKEADLWWYGFTPSSKIRLGDPPTDQMVAVFNEAQKSGDHWIHTNVHTNGYSGRETHEPWTGTGIIDGFLSPDPKDPTNGGFLEFDLHYHFENNKLTDVKFYIVSLQEGFLHDQQKNFEQGVKLWTEKLGCPPHYVNHPTFLTDDGAIHQNQVVGWETDSGRWELHKFDATEKRDWATSRGILVPNTQ